MTLKAAPLPLLPLPALLLPAAAAPLQLLPGGRGPRRGAGGAQALGEAPAAQAAGRVLLQVLGVLERAWQRRQQAHALALLRARWQSRASAQAQEKRKEQMMQWCQQRKRQGWQWAWEQTLRRQHPTLQAVPQGVLEVLSRRL